MYTLRESVLYLFAKIDDVQLSKHALTSHFTYLMATVLLQVLFYEIVAKPKTLCNDRKCRIGLSLC